MKLKTTVEMERGSVPSSPDPRSSHVGRPAAKQNAHEDDSPDGAGEQRLATPAEVIEAAASLPDVERQALLRALLCAQAVEKQASSFSLKEAAGRAGVWPEAVARWCRLHPGLGRKVAGRWKDRLTTAPGRPALAGVPAMSRSLPPTVLPRVGQLLRMLGSDQPGEVVAAVGALRRTLVGAGVDLHDLAATVERPVAVSEPERSAARKAKKPAPRPRPQPAEAPPRQPPPPPREPHRPDLVSLSVEQRAAVLEGLTEAIEDVDGRLTEWQHTFAANLLETIGRRRLCPTEKQMRFIRDIVKTLRGEAS